MSDYDSRPLRKLTKLRKSDPLVSPLEAAYEAAADARDIIQDKRRRELPDYDADSEESTARHQLPEQHFHFTANVGTPSQPDLKLEGELEVGPIKVRGIPRWIGVGLALLVAGVTAFIAAKLGGH